MAADTSLLVEARDSVLLLKLSDPSGFPRLTRSVLREIEAAIATLNVQDEWRGAVISGTYKCFAAGADLEEIENLDDVSAREFAESGQRVMRAVENSKKPVIAAVRGYCFGGGFDLALACRARVASQDALFAHRGAALGIITGWGGTQRLPRLLGPRGKALALELMTSGRTMDSGEAAESGLVAEIVPSPRVDHVASDFVIAASRASMQEVRSRKGERTTYTESRDPHRS